METEFTSNECRGASNDATQRCLHTSEVADLRPVVRGAIVMIETTKLTKNLLGLSPLMEGCDEDIQSKERCQRDKVIPDSEV